MEEERRQGVAQMPFDVIGEHAEEDMGAHAVCRPVSDRPDVEIDGFQGPEGAFDTGEILIGLHRLGGS